MSYLGLNWKSEGNGKNTKYQVPVGRSGGSEIYLLALPWWFSGWNSILLVQGAGVHSLVRELRSLCGAAWPKINKIAIRIIRK